jgi:hypothetical protein
MQESIDGYMGDSDTLQNWEVDGSDPASYPNALNTPEYGQVTGADASSPTRTRTRPPGNTGSYYKYIGPVAGPRPLNTGANSMQIGSASFGAYPGWGFSASRPDLYDDFAFDKATGTVYVNGTVFIDGDLVFDSAVTQYAGNGTLVVNGNITVNGGLGPAGGAFGANNCLGLVAAGDIMIDHPTKAAIFCNGTLSLLNTGTNFTGTALCGAIYGDKPGQAITMDPILKTVLPKSMPAAGGGWLAMSAWTRP